MTGENGQIPFRRRSQHPYRDSAIVYAVLGTVVIIVALVTGSHVVPAIVAGIAAFVLATAYTWWRVRAREQQQRRRR
jgi:Flp pilus assembly protein TadB